MLALALLAGLLSGCGGGGGTTVTAQFRDAAGLFEGNDVGVLGVHVGTVTKVTPSGDHVNVTLHVDPGVKIPANAGAVVVSRSVATDRYVELTPVYDSGPVLRTGTVLPIAKTRTPVEFDDLLSSLKDISSTVAGPKATPRRSTSCSASAPRPSMARALSSVRPCTTWRSRWPQLTTARAT